MIVLDLDAGPMALVDNNGKKTWIVYAKDRSVSYKLNITVGPHQMDMVEKSEQFVEPPCA
jgi:hypothetical protein